MKKGYDPPEPVPETMVPWDGQSDNGPTDWDGGRVYFRMGRMSDPGEGPQSDDQRNYNGVGNWFHGRDNDSAIRGLGAFDVIFYNRKEE